MIMKRFLIKIAYKILQYYSLETMPYIYWSGEEYKVVVVNRHYDKGTGCGIRIYAERKR